MTTTLVTVLTKVRGEGLDRVRIHLMGGCRPSRQIRAEEWQRTEMDYDAWRALPRHCEACARMAVPRGEREE